MLCRVSSRRDAGQVNASETRCAYIITDAINTTSTLTSTKLSITRKKKIEFT